MSKDKPVTEAQKKATAKYESKAYDKILLRVPKGTKDRIKATGADSVNGYIAQALMKQLEQDEAE